MAGLCPRKGAVSSRMGVQGLELPWDEVEELVQTCVGLVLAAPMSVSWQELC